MKFEFGSDVQKRQNQGCHGKLKSWLYFGLKNFPDYIMKNYVKNSLFLLESSMMYPPIFFLQKISYFSEYSNKVNTFLSIFFGNNFDVN